MFGLPHEFAYTALGFGFSPAHIAESFTMAFLRTSLRFGVVPLILLFLFILFVATYRFLGLPSVDELVELARNYYTQHGHLVVLVGALAEGLLVVNWYLPGSFVLVLGVTFSEGRPLNAVSLVAIIILAFFVTTILNYTMGRYAWYRFLLFFGLKAPLQKVKSQVEKRGLSIIYITYFHPNVGALTALSCGIIQLPLRKFVIHSGLALVLWNLLWGLVVYLVGPWLLRLLNVWLVFPLLVVWLVGAVVRAAWISKKRGRRAESSNF